MARSATAGGSRAEFTSHVRARRRLVTALVLAGAAVRVAVMIRYANPADPQLWEFGEIARNLVATGVYSLREPGVPTAYMPPGFALLIAALYALFGVGLAAHLVLAVVLLAASLGIALVSRSIAARLWGRDASIVALAVALFSPTLLLMSGRLTNFPLVAFLLLLAALAAISERRSLPARGALAGIVLGVYGVMRFEAIVFLAPFVWFFARAPGDHSRGARTVAIALLVACFLAPIVPWLARNAAVFGTPILGTSGGFNLHRGHHAGATGTGRDLWPAARDANPDDPAAGWTPLPSAPGFADDDWNGPADELAWDAAYRRAALDYIRSYPRHEIALAARKAYYFLVADFTHPVARLPLIWLPSLVALAIGLAWAIHHRMPDARERLLWLLFAAQLFIATAFFVLPRYRMAVEPIPLLFFAGWAGTAIVPRIERWIASRRARR